MAIKIEIRKASQEKLHVWQPWLSFQRDLSYRHLTLFLYKVIESVNVLSKPWVGCNPNRYATVERDGQGPRPHLISSCFEKGKNHTSSLEALFFLQPLNNNAPS